jgi:sigma-B regulation protein RsbU (phosphoserine phosphatase)
LAAAKGARRGGPPAAPDAAAAFRSCAPPHSPVSQANTSLNARGKDRLRPAESPEKQRVLHVVRDAETRAPPVATGTDIDCCPVVAELSDALPVPRVLVADDQADILTALQLLLRNAGFDTDSTTSVQGVRDRLIAGNYDLLLMDLNYARDTTSGQEGLALVDEVRARDGLLPIVVMTGWGSIDTAVEAMRRGARAFVQKPWDNATLARMVRREVDEGLARRRATASESREIDEAKAIQRALLPSPLPSFPGCEMAALWRPASAFGGDCYDAARIGETAARLSIADVAGKGLPAALVMSHLQASVRAFAVDAAPDAVAARTNRHLCAIPGLHRFVTFFHAIIDTGARTLTYTNAGHPPPILVRADGAVHRLNAGGPLLGFFEESAYAQGQLTLRSGDRLVLFTDGITEAEDASENEFGEDRLVAAVLEHRDQTAAALVAGVFTQVLNFSGGSLHDDATMFVVAFDP